jgi:hypothetical protein
MIVAAAASTVKRVPPAVPPFVSTASVLFIVVAPATPSVLLSVVAPVTPSVLLSVVAPVTPSVVLTLAEFSVARPDVPSVVTPLTAPALVMPSLPLSMPFVIMLFCIVMVPALSADRTFETPVEIKNDPVPLSSESYCRLTLFAFDTIVSTSPSA